MWQASVGIWDTVAKVIRVVFCARPPKLTGRQAKMMSMSVCTVEHVVQVMVCASLVWLFT